MIHTPLSQKKVRSHAKETVNNLPSGSWKKSPQNYKFWANNCAHEWASNIIYWDVLCDKVKKICSASLRSLTKISKVILLQIRIILVISDCHKVICSLELRFCWMELSKIGHGFYYCNCNPPNSAHFLTDQIKWLLSMIHIMATKGLWNLQTSNKLSNLFYRVSKRFGSFQKYGLCGSLFFFVFKNACTSF